MKKRRLIPLSLIERGVSFDEEESDEEDKEPPSKKKFTPKKKFLASGSVSTMRSAGE